MCLVIDTNCLADLCNGSEDMRPVLEWLGFGKPPKGQLALSSHPEIEEEFFGPNAPIKFMEIVRALTWIRTPETITEEQINSALDDANIEFSSNDELIVALAMASGCKMLVSKDRALHKDFKKATGGRVYQKAQTHKKMLAEYKCR